MIAVASEKSHTEVEPMLEREPVDARRPFMAHLDGVKRGPLLILDLENNPEFTSKGDVPVMVVPLTAESVRHVGEVLAAAIGPRSAARALSVLGIEEVAP